MQIITVHATKIEIRWVAGFDGGVDQTFVLEYRLSKTTSWNTSYPNWTGLEEDPQYFELSGLSSGSVYDIQMYARNTVGNSLKTNIISVSTTIISVPTTTTTPTPGTTIISVSVCQQQQSVYILFNNKVIVFNYRYLFCCFIKPNSHIQCYSI